MEDGVYIGTALRDIASQSQPQAGITDFATQLSAEVARSPDHELLDLLPTQRSQISYRSGFKNFVLHTDASFQLGFQGDWDWWLLEYERRATTPKRVSERLRPYRRYSRSGYATLDHAPFVSTHTDVLARQGVLGESWCLPPPYPPGRQPLHDLRAVQTSPTARPERFL